MMTDGASGESLRPRLVAAFGNQLQIGPMLGAGGFAAVFQAHDPVLRRDVALKVVDLAPSPLADQRDQYLAEARTMATVEHPHIVPVYGVEVRDGMLCLAMRLVPGRSLAERIAQGPLPPAEVARVGREIAEALAAAHARGVVHRDVKPENVLIDGNGHAMVSDFGIAMVTGRTSDRVPGVAVGTPQYLSPEQALGEPVDGRADVYSLGVVLYEMVSGRLPFEAATTHALIAKQVLEVPPPLDRIRPDLPAPLVEVITRALVKAPADRPRAAEIAAALAAAGSEKALTPPSVLRRKARWRRIRRIVAVAAVLAVVVGVGAWSAWLALTTFAGGRLPGLSASGENIPAALIDSARAAGALDPDEVVTYAFVPAGKTWTDGLLLTDRAIVRRTAAGARRFVRADTFTINVFRKGPERGLFIARPNAPADTLYRGLSGSELGALWVAVNPPDSSP